MQRTPDLDSKKIALADRGIIRKDKNLAHTKALDIIPSRLGCGCSSVVEHLLAKEDVASSSLVTRSKPGKAVLPQTLFLAGHR